MIRKFTRSLAQGVDMLPGVRNSQRTDAAMLDRRRLEIDVSEAELAADCEKFLAELAKHWTPAEMVAAGLTHIDRRAAERALARAIAYAASPYPRDHSAEQVVRELVCTLKCAHILRD